MPIFNFTKGRSTKLSVEAQVDVILHCKRPSQDAHFAAKYKVSESCIRHYRLGQHGVDLREKLETGWRP